jgi:hypothetical protein
MQGARDLIRYSGTGGVRHYSNSRNRGIGWWFARCKFAVAIDPTHVWMVLLNSSISDRFQQVCHISGA